MANNNQNVVQAVAMSDIATAISGAGIEYTENKKGELLVSSAGSWVTQNKKGTFVMGRGSVQDDQYGKKYEVRDTDTVITILRARQTEKSNGNTTTTTTTQQPTTDSDSDSESEEVASDSSDEDDDIEPVAWTDSDESNQENLVKQVLDIQKQLVAIKKQAQNAKPRLSVDNGKLKKVIEEEVGKSVDKILHRASEYIVRY